MVAAIAYVDVPAARSRPVRVVLEHGDEILLAASVARELDLEPGVRVTPEWMARRREREIACARDRALRLLGCRERTTHELERRLAGDGYPQDVAENVVGSLAELGLVDDARYASAYVRSKAAAGYGRRRIGRELAAAGVSSTDADAALDEALPIDGELERARGQLKRRPTSAADRRKAAARLIRRGYESHTAWQAVAGDDPGALDEP